MDFSGISSVGSPYMNIDPRFLNTDTEPHYLTLQPQDGPVRGRFEMAFNQIGGAICLASGAGGMCGYFQGLKETRAANITGSVKRTQLINFIVKKGSSSGQAVGTMALLYSIFGTILAKGRGAEDELNTVAAATATGLLYKSPGGLRKSLRGGFVGLGIAVVYTLITSRDNVKKMTGF